MVPAPVRCVLHPCPRELVFIDAAVEDVRTLLAGLRPGIEAHVVQGGTDGLAQMARVLAGYSGLSAVHVVSHGAPGRVDLGTARLSLTALDAYKAELRALGGALRPGGDLLLYGCRVAEAAGGRDFLRQLARSTGANVAASATPTGSVVLGGDWDLEAEVGAVHTCLAFDARALEAFPGLLALVTTGTEGVVNGDMNDSGQGAVVSVNNVPGQGQVSITLVGSDGSVGTTVTTTTAAEDLEADVAVASDGSFAAVYETASGLLLQRFNADGSKNGTEITVVSSGTDVGHSGIAVDASSNYTVAYVDSAGQVNATKYNSAGAVVGAEVQINIATANPSDSRGLDIDIDGGRVVVVWDRVSDNAVVARVLGSNHNPEGIEEFVVSSATSYFMPRVDLNGSGAGAVTLISESGEVSYQRIDASGSGATSGSPIPVGTADAVGSGIELNDDGTLAMLYLRTDGGNVRTPTLVEFDAGDTQTRGDTSLGGSAPAGGDQKAHLFGTDAGDFLAVFIEDASDDVFLEPPPNEGPTIGNLDGDALAYDEGDGAVLIDQGTVATITDSDSTDFDGGSLTVSVTAGGDAAEDVLAIDTSGSVSISGDGTVSNGNVVSVSGVAVGEITSNGVGNDLVISFNQAAGNATAGRAQTLVQSITYQNANNAAPTTGARSVEFSVADGDGGTGTATTTVTVSGVNDPPAFRDLDGGSTFTEGSSPVPVDPDVTVTDPELDARNGGNGNYDDATLTVTRQGDANSDDAFSVASGGSLTVSGGPNGGGTISAGGNVIANIADVLDNDELQITFANNGTEPTTALVNEVMQAIRYANTSDDPPADVTLAWSISDGNSGAQGSGGVESDTGTPTVSIIGVNDEPTLVVTGQDPTFTEGGSATDLFSGVTASTVESGQTLTSMTLTVTNVSDGSSEILSFDGSDVVLTDGNAVTTATNGLNVSVSLSGTTATVSFTGASLSEAELETLVDGLTYRNESDAPSTANRVVTITELVDSGSNVPPNDNTASPNLTSTVTVEAVNDAPINNLQSTSESVAENGSLIFDAANANRISVSDVDVGGDELQVELTVSNGTLSLPGTAGLTFSAGDGTGDATMTFSGTQTNINSALDGVVYAPLGGFNGGDTLTITTNDQGNNGIDPSLSGDANTEQDEDQVALTVEAVNDDPSAANLPTDVTVTEDVLSNLDLSAATLGDPDSGVNDISLVLNVTSGTLAFTDQANVDETLSNGNQTLTLVGTVAELDSYLKTASNIRYLSALNANGNDADTLTLVANDGGHTGSGGGGDVTLGTVNIDIAAVNDAPQIANLDGDSPGVVAGDAPAAIDVGGDALVSDPDGASDFDGGNLFVEQTAGTANGSFSVDGVNVTAGGDATISAGETIQVGGLSFGAVNAVNDGQGGNDLRIDITGGAAATPAQVSALIQNLFYNAPSGVGARNFEVTVNDGDGTANGGQDTSLASLVTVAVAANPPVVVNLNGDSVNGFTGGRTVAIDAGADARVTDADSANFGGGSLVVTRAGVGLGDFQVDGANVTSGGNRSISAGEAVAVGGVVVGTVSAVADGQGSDDLQIDLNADATESRVEVLIQNLRYTGQTTGTQDFELVLTDGDGAASAPAAFSVVVSPPPASGGCPDPNLLIGSPGDDTLSGGIGNDTLLGGDGDDRLEGGRCDDILFGNVGDDFLEGGAERDFLHGGVGNDVLFGGGKSIDPSDGNDTVRGGRGEDVIYGNGGDDSLRGNSGDDALLGNEGSDTVFGNAGDDFGVGGPGPDYLRGGVGDDALAGGRGDDTIIAGVGRDVASGGAGNDLMSGGKADDTLIGRLGDDVIAGGSGNDSLRGSGGNDTMIGGIGDDTIVAGIGDDVANGGAGNDLISGGRANDRLAGGPGDDTLLGGLGNDIFVFGIDSGQDTIKDFQGAGKAIGDQIAISLAQMASDEEVLAAVTEVNGNAVIDLGVGNTITLDGVDGDLLTGRDFFFFI